MKLHLIFLFSAIFFTTTLIVNGQTKNVLMKTNCGDIKIILYDETPLHRDNFIKLVNEGFYDSLLFHRVINEFMIQGGDPNSKNSSSDKTLGNGGPGYTISAEINLKYYHKKGALAAARLSDNINPDKKSSGSQFYIVHGRKFKSEELNTIGIRMKKSFTAEQINTYKTIGGTPHLDDNYTVFGEITEGMDVVDKIAVVKTNQNNRPIEDVIIISVEIIE